jgi:hypothetical protein
MARPNRSRIQALGSTGEVTGAFVWPAQNCTSGESTWIELGDMRQVLRTSGDGRRSRRMGDFT